MTDRIRHRGIVALLDEDPDLAEGVPETELDAARRQAIVALVEIDPPSWDPTELRDQVGPGWLGLMVLDGLILRRVDAGPRAACEILGRGDLLRPWDTDGDYDPLAITVGWLVLRPARLAVLDAAFVLRTARWPVINSRIVSRVAQRARYLALAQSVTHLPRAHARLLLLMLVGAQRPTVTLALQKLSRAELVLREPPDRWLLTGRAIEMLARPESLALLEEPDDVG